MEALSISFAVVIGLGYLALAIFSLLSWVTFIKNRTNFKDRNKPPFWITLGIIVTCIGKSTGDTNENWNCIPGREVNVGLTSVVSLESENEFQYVLFLGSN